MLASNYWPEPSAHQIYWEQHNNPYVYEYDPVDDGPEADGGAKAATLAILASHDSLDLAIEREEHDAFLLLREIFPDLLNDEFIFDFGDLWL